MNFNLLPETEKRNQLSAMRTGYFEMENYRIEWTPEEIELLKKFFVSGVGISEIALALGRSERAVIQRIEQERLFKKVRKPTENSSKPTCKCAKCELKDACKNGIERCGMGV